MYSLYFIVTLIIFVVALTVLFGYVANTYMDKHEKVKKEEEENHGTSNTKNDSEDNW